MLWCRRSPRRTGHSAQRPSGVYVDLDTSIEVQKRTAERVSEESADATWRRERAARAAREKAAAKQRRQAQRARRAVLPALVDQPRGSTAVLNAVAASLSARGP